MMFSICHLSFAFAVALAFAVAFAFAFAVAVGIGIWALYSPDAPLHVPPVSQTLPHLHSHSTLLQLNPLPLLPPLTHAPIHPSNLPLCKLWDQITRIGHAHLRVPEPFPNRRLPDPPLLKVRRLVVVVAGNVLEIPVDVLHRAKRGAFLTRVESSERATIYC